jgi:hypothetical protein
VGATRPRSYSTVFCGSLLAWAIFCEPVLAQDGPPHAQGYIRETEQELLTVPRAPTYRAVLPESVDLSRYFPPVGDQGDQGSCTAWAVGYAARAYYAKTKENRDNTSKLNIPSPAYIYDSIKTAGNCDTGSNILSAMQLLQRGALSLNSSPYDEKKCPKPSATDVARATDFRVQSYQQVYSNDDIKGALANGNPVVVGIAVTRKFQLLGPGDIYITARIPARCYRSPWCAGGPNLPEGHHAIALVGYDERKQAFKFINSWSRSWGDAGYGWIDYDTFQQAQPNAFVMGVESPRPPPSPPVVVVPPGPEPAPPPKPAPTPVVVIVPPEPPKPFPSPIALPELECSEIRIAESGTQQRVEGFVGHDADLEKIRTAAQGAEVDVQVRPFPQCEALITLDKPLARPESELPKVKIRQSASGTLAEGDDLVFEIETPPYPSYLHVAYFQADGTGYQRVVNLIQPGIGSYTTYPPRTKLVLGDDPGARKFKVSPPFGREMLIVLAAHSPIFPKRREDQETEREFLTALRRALLWKVDPSAPDRDVVAAYDTTITTERKAP